MHVLFRSIAISYIRILIMHPKLQNKLNISPERTNPSHNPTICGVGSEIQVNVSHWTKYTHHYLHLHALLSLLRQISLNDWQTEKESISICH